MSAWGSEAVYDDKMVANVDVDERVGFIRRTYAHLAGAIVAFILLEVLMFQTGLAASYSEFVFGLPYGHLIVFVLFMAAGWVADRWAQSDASQGLQYAGLALYTVAEVAFLTPLLFYIAFFTDDPNTIPMAGITTLCTFAGLTGIVFVTRKDFSFLRAGLGIASLLAFGLIICSIIFGLSLGLWFAVGMAALMGGWILYYTSNILHHYRTHQHVAASLALFACIATLFFYILQIFMSRD